MAVLDRHTQPEYKRWQKLLKGIYIVKDVLSPHVETVFHDFHANLLIGKLGAFCCFAPTLQLVLDKTTNKWKITGAPACTGNKRCPDWLDTIAAEHLHGNRNDLFKSCDLTQLDASFWEVAKTFLTPVQASGTNGPADLSPYFLMKMIMQCRLFSQPPHDIHKAVAKVLCTRNELAHSAVQGINTDTEVTVKIDEMIDLVRLLPTTLASIIGDLEKVRDGDIDEISKELTPREVDIFRLFLRDAQQGSHKQLHRIKKEVEEGRAKITGEVQAVERKVEEGDAMVTKEVKAVGEQVYEGGTKVTYEVQAVGQKVEECGATVTREVQAVGQKVQTVGDKVEEGGVNVTREVQAVGQQVQAVGYKVEEGGANVTREVQAVGQQVQAVGYKVEEGGVNVTHEVQAVGQQVQAVGYKVEEGGVNVTREVQAVGQQVQAVGYKVEEGGANVTREVQAVGQQVQAVGYKVEEGGVNVTREVQAVGQQVQAVGYKVEEGGVNVTREVQAVGQQVQAVGYKVEEGGVKVTCEVQAVGQKVEEGSTKVTSEVQAVRQKVEEGGAKFTSEMQAVLKRLEEGSAKFDSVVQAVMKIEANVAREMEAVREKTETLMKKVAEGRTDVTCDAPTITEMVDESTKVTRKMEAVGQKVEQTQSQNNDSRTGQRDWDYHQREIHFENDNDLKLNTEDSDIGSQKLSSNNSSESKESVGSADELKPKKDGNHSDLSYETYPCSKMSNVVVHNRLVANRKLKMMLVGHNGATLSFAQEDITLVVPFGALNKGQQKPIVLGCSTNVADIPHLGDHQVSASSIVHCLPHGTEFNEVVAVRIGLHHNGEVDDHPGSLRVLHSMTDLGQPTNWREMPTGSEQHGSNNIVLVTERDVYIMVKSFCAWCVVRDLPHGYKPPVPFYTRIMIFAKLSQQPALVTFTVVFADSSLEKDIQQDCVDMDYGHKIVTRPLRVYCLDEPITVHIGHLCSQWKQHEHNLNSQGLKPQDLLDKEKTSVMLWLHPTEKNINECSLLSCSVEVEQGLSKESIMIVKPLSELTLSDEYAEPSAKKNQFASLQQPEAELHGSTTKDMQSNAIPEHATVRDPSGQTRMSGGQNAACSGSSYASCSSYPDNQPQQLVSARGEFKTNEMSRCPNVPGKEDYHNSSVRLKDFPKTKTTISSVNGIPSSSSAGIQVLSFSPSAGMSTGISYPVKLGVRPVDVLTNSTNNNSSDEEAHCPPKRMRVDNDYDSCVNKCCNSMDPEVAIAARTTRKTVQGIIAPVSPYCQHQSGDQIQPGCPTDTTRPESSEEGSVTQVTTGQHELDGQDVPSAVPDQEQTTLKVTPVIRRQSLEEDSVAQATTMQDVLDGRLVHQSVSAQEQTTLQVSSEATDESVVVISEPNDLYSALGRQMNKFSSQLERTDHQAGTFIQHNSIYVQSSPSATNPCHCDILTQMQPESVVLSNMACGVICRMLDERRDNFKDWRGFADKLGVSGWTGSLEQRHGSPTWELLKLWRSQRKPLDHLMALLNKMGRSDVAEALAEAVSKEKDME